MKKLFYILIILVPFNCLFGQCNPTWTIVSGANQVITTNSRVLTGTSLTGTLTVNAGVTLCTEGTAAITVSTLTNNGTINHNGTGMFTANKTVVNNGTINISNVGFTKTNSSFSFTNNSNATFNSAGSVSIQASSFTNGSNATFSVTGNLSINCHTDNYGSIIVTGNLSKTNSGKSFDLHTGSIFIQGTSSIFVDSLILDNGTSLISNGNITIKGVIWNSGVIETTNGTLYKQFSSSLPIYNFATGQIKSFGDMTLEGQIINDGLIEITNSGIFGKTNSSKSITNNATGRIIIKGSTSDFTANGALYNSGYILSEGNMNRAISTANSLNNSSTGYIRVCGKYSKKKDLINNGIIEVGNDLFFTGSSSVNIQNNATGKIHIVNNLDFFCNLKNYGHIIIGDSLWHRNNSSGTITIADSGSINVVNYIHNNGALIGGGTPAQIGYLRICGTSKTLNTVSISGYLDICDAGHMTVAPYFDTESPSYAYPLATVSDCGSRPPDTTSSFVDTCSNIVINSASCTFIVLPIELTTFDVIQENEWAKIYWTTASEINNDYFTIERSINGFNFKNIGTVKGAGNSTSILNYTFYDKNPYIGTSYYRLKQTDFDGKYKYSNIVALNFKQNTIFSIYPNPTNGNIVKITSSNFTIKQVRLYNSIGQDVSDNITILNRNENEMIIDVSNLKKGVYFITIDNIEFKRLIKN